jgi:ribonucleotide reductase alpha subunit
MMADMGILGVPRTLMEEIYKFDDLEQFLKDGIQEEIGAKEECKRLAEAVSDSSEHFSAFFTFINNQENYHIALMEEALAHINQ